MDRTIEAAALDAIEVSSDGGAIRVGFKDTEGQDAQLFMPDECAGQLAMSLPRSVSAALQMRHRDKNVRLVFPVGEWTLEAASDCSTVILTLRTSDGFEASYSLDRSGADELARSLDDAPSRMPASMLRN